MKNYLLFISIFVVVGLLIGCSGGGAGGTSGTQGTNSSANASESNRIDQQQFDKAKLE